VIFSVTFLPTGVLQIEALSEEKKRLGSDIVDLQNRMRDELEIQQLQHFKVTFTHSPYIHLQPAVPYGPAIFSA